MMARLVIAFGLLSYVDGLIVPQTKARFVRVAILHSRLTTRDEDNGFVHLSSVEDFTAIHKGAAEDMDGNQGIYRANQHPIGNVDKIFQNFLSSDEIVPAEIFSNDTVLTIEAIDEILAVVHQVVSNADTLQAQNSHETLTLLQSNLHEATSKPVHLEDVNTPIKEQNDDEYDYPSSRYIMTFAASAIGVYLCSPLLSLIDTSAVGLLSGTAQQAALNPAVAVTDYGALLMVSGYIILRELT
jgi:hypothetical protein